MVPKVTVVTRTKNRPIFLKRAYRHLCKQTYQDFHWVIVNDDGVRSPVDSLAGAAKDAGMMVTVIHNDAPQGIEYVANLGILSSDEPYIMVHDDDDTLHPAYLSETAAALEGQPDWVGVITGVEQVHERVSDGKISIIMQRPYLMQPRSVSLKDLGVLNRFPPIALLYRRKIYSEIGGYDETMPVLGDWDFNLRLANAGRIGVIKRRLANYHHREPGSDKFANNIDTERAVHEMHMAVVREKYVQNGPQSIATVLTEGVSQVNTIRAPLSYRLRSFELRQRRKWFS